MFTIFFFFYLTFRPPPRSTLFPTRRSSDLKDLTIRDEVRLPSKPAAVQEIGEPQDAKFFQLLGLFASNVNNTSRSEEHTSELQSRPHLVCRLLLEKKKK